MKFLRAVPVVFALASGFVSAAPLPQTDIDAREPIAPLFAAAASFLPSIFSGLKGLFGRDAGDDLLEELAAAALFGNSKVAARSVEDLDARRIVLPSGKEFFNILTRIFTRDVDDNDELEKDLAILQALSARDFGELTARALEDLDARDPLIGSLFASLAPALIGPAISGIKKLFSRDVSDDVAEALVEALVGNSGVSRRSAISDEELKAVTDLLAGIPFSRIGDLEARDPRIVFDSIGGVLKTLGGALFRAFTKS
jgi:uncharacterized protein (DUF697 family)